MNDKSNHRYEVYVDGSFKHGGMASGWIIHKPDGEVYLKGSQQYSKQKQPLQNSTMAEHLAVLEALRRLPPKSDAVIFTDSMSTMDILEGSGKARRGYETVFENIHRAMQALGQLDFRWMPSHTGLITGSEDVHDLAEIAASRRSSRPAKKGRNNRIIATMRPSQG